jgi:hypothetical protein
VTLTTFHLFRVPPAKVPAAVLRMAADRGPLRRTRGLRFAKLVGTGSGRTFGIRDADPTRWGVLAVWDSAADARRFERGSDVLRAWDRIAVERWRGDLLLQRSRGAWSGREPFGEAAQSSSDGPVVAITRARIRWRLAPRFWAAVPPVSADLVRQPGLRCALGIGEAPIGLQGTFSVWSSGEALRSFAYGREAHRTAIHTTAQLGWYAEELFARFALVDSQGTIDGRDPAAGGSGNA